MNVYLIGMVLSMIVYIIVGILVACMVVPMFYNLILAMTGNAG